MKPSEVAALLSMIVFYDPRIQYDEGKLAAWSSALVDDMPLQFAREAVNNHYAKSREAIMPADINEAWVIELRSEMGRWKKEQFELEMAQAEAEAVPPDSDLVRDILSTMLKFTPEVVKIPCPHCGAGVMERCRLKNGQILTKSHAHPARFKQLGMENAPVAIREPDSSSHS